MAKQRSTSINENANTVAAALTDIAPPKEAGELNEEELAIFHLYTGGKAATDWFDYELLHVAQLSKLTTSINEHQRQIELEGVVIMNSRGTMVMNPLQSVIDTKMRTQLAMIRSLNLASSATQKKEHNTGRAKQQKSVKKKVTNRKGLLAVPTAQK